MQGSRFSGDDRHTSTARSVVGAGGFGEVGLHQCHDNLPAGFFDPVGDHVSRRGWRWSMTGVQSRMRGAHFAEDELLFLEDEVLPLDGVLSEEEEAEEAPLFFAFFPPA